MSFDFRSLRQQFPIFEQPIHGHPLHYLDNAATAQTPLAVLDAVRHHETRSRANVLRSVHFLAEAATEAYENARVTIASYLNAASPEEIIVTSGCTGALNLAAHSFGALLKPGDEILISALDHHSNIVPWHLLRDRLGVTLKPIPVTEEGRLDLAALDTLVTPRTKLIAVTHASNVTGAETDVARIVAAARSVHARVLLDGAQRAPHGPIDVQALGVDFYALAGHKMFGPNGIGILWARRDLLDLMPPFLGGGEMIRQVTMLHSTYADPPRRFEAGTPPIAQAVGLAAAADWVRSLDGEQVHAHLSALTGRLLDGLAAIDRGAARIRVIGPTGLQGRLPLVSFVVAGAHPHDICQILDQRGVALRGGHHCAEPLMDSLGIGGTTRASLAAYNGDDDIDAFLNGLEDAVAMFKR
jgi:cysteine desulfurase/selenocysteine lyase